jgi:hypothetical protein
LTQAFFLRLLERRWVDAADRERGRFRTFATRFNSPMIAALSTATSNRRTFCWTGMDG